MILTSIESFFLEEYILSIKNGEKCIFSILFIIGQLQRKRRLQQSIFGPLGGIFG
jgi:hypothetical protein